MSAVNLQDYKVTFLGRCMGVGLRPRSNIGDQHVCYEILVEDDGNWYTNSGFSSTHWMPEVMEKLAEAQKWLDDNATKYKYGYLFK